jgi:hypothetical protein
MLRRMHAVHQRRRPGVVADAFLDFRNVGTGSEGGIARALNDQHLDCGIDDRIADQFGQQPPHRRRHGVARRRPIDH